MLSLIQAYSIQGRISKQCSASARVSTMKLAWHKMGFTVNLRADATSVSILEHVVSKKYFCFLALCLKSGPCCTCLKCISYLSLKAASSKGHTFSGQGAWWGCFQGIVYHFSSEACCCSNCLLSFLNCFAICSRPRWQRSVEALTGTCVLYQAKRRYKMESWAESYKCRVY